MRVVRGLERFRCRGCGRLLFRACFEGVMEVKCRCGIINLFVTVGDEGVECVEVESLQVGKLESLMLI